MKETLIDLAKSFGFMAAIVLWVVIMTVSVNAYPNLMMFVTLFGGWMALFWMYRRNRQIDSKA